LSSQSKKNTLLNLTIKSQGVSEESGCFHGYERLFHHAQLHGAPYRLPALSPIKNKEFPNSIHLTSLCAVMGRKEREEKKDTLPLN
jgi:hypothetical protein